MNKLEFINTVEHHAHMLEADINRASNFNAPYEWSGIDGLINNFELGKKYLMVLEGGKSTRHIVFTSWLGAAEYFGVLMLNDFYLYTLNDDLIFYCISR